MKMEPSIAVKTVKERVAVLSMNVRMRRGATVRPLLLLCRVLNCLLRVCMCV